MVKEQGHTQVEAKMNKAAMQKDRGDESPRLIIVYNLGHILGSKLDQGMNCLFVT